MLTDLLPWFSQFALLQIQDHLPKDGHCPQWAKPANINHQLRKCPSGLLQGNLTEAFFSIEILSFQMTLACVEVTIQYYYQYMMVSHDLNE